MRGGGITPATNYSINKQYTFTKQIRSRLDNNNVNKINVKTMEFILLITIVTIVRIAEKLAKIEER